MKVDIAVFATWPDDLHQADIEGIKEDIEDICRFSGGHAVLAIKVNDVEWEPSS